MRRVLHVAAAALAAACGGAPRAGPGIAGGPQPPIAAFPVGRPAALVIGAGGGSVTLGNLTLTVPPGAVAVDTDFSLTALDPNTAVSGVGTAYDVQPQGAALLAPVTLTFAVADSTGLAASHQIQLGYWLRAYAVTTTPTTVSVSTTDLGAWSLVTIATSRDLTGPFRLDSTTQDVPLGATGTVTLNYIGEERQNGQPAFTYFIPVGTITPASPGCTTPAAQPLPLSLAETSEQDSVVAWQFRWAILGTWNLSCGSESHFVSTGFDTMGIYNQGCSLGYSGAMPVSTSPTHLSGQFVIDCGPARGTVTASWDLLPPGGTPGALPPP